MGGRKKGPSATNNVAQADVGKQETKRKGREKQHLQVTLTLARPSARSLPPCLLLARAGPCRQGTGDRNPGGWPSPRQVAPFLLLAARPHPYNVRTAPYSTVPRTGQTQDTVDMREGESASSGSSPNNGLQARQALRTDQARTLETRTSPTQRRTSPPKPGRRLCTKHVCTVGPADGTCRSGWDMGIWMEGGGWPWPLSGRPVGGRCR